MQDTRFRVFPLFFGTFSITSLSVFENTQSNSRCEILTHRLGVIKTEAHPATLASENSFIPDGLAAPNCVTQNLIAA